MAIPSLPQNFFAQQANAQVYLLWDIVAGATTYTIQRSLDGVTFTTLASPAVNYYLDTTVTIGTRYYYQVASTNSSGTSSYTAAQLVIPTLSADLSLAQVRVMSQQRADRLGSNFVTLPEWNSYINQSYFELYDLLVSLYEDYYLAPAALFTANGSTFLYPLPDGVTTFQNSANANFIPDPMYKLRGVDLALNNTNNAFVSIHKFMFEDRNRFVYPNTASTIYGVFNLQYRVMGDKLELIPTPAAGQQIRLWYIPRLNQLLQENDIMKGVSGWTEYVIVDAAIKALQKEESDVSVLIAQKQALIMRINASASNRDAGQPDRISDVTQGNPYGFNGPFGGFGGGF